MESVNAHAGQAARRGSARARRCALAVVLAGWMLATTALGAEGLAPVQTLAFYRDTLTKPIEDKISLGDPAIIDWQERVNRQFGQEVRPNPASPGHPLVPRIRAMLAALPPRIHELASRHVVAVYLLENDWGTGTTEAVQDELGRWRYGYIALNLTVLERTANGWGSWKEGSAFRPEPPVSIEMTLEPADRDSVDGALRFIFLHELGHVLGLALGVHGWWDAEPLPPETVESPFVRQSWQADGAGKLVSRWRERFPMLSLLDFYSFAEARLSAGQAAEAYQALAQTNFPSLYGATNAYDDWAEAFAVYVHTRLLRMPYSVRAGGGAGTAVEYRSCIAAGNCPDKVAWVERYLDLRPR
jgi:hypothetical protein